MRHGDFATIVIAIVLVGSSSMGAHATTATQLNSPSQLSAQDQAFAITPAIGTVSAGPTLSLTSGTQGSTFTRSSGQFEIDQADVNYGQTALLVRYETSGGWWLSGSRQRGPVSLAFALPVSQFGLNIEDFNSVPFIVSFSAFNCGWNVAWHVHRRRAKRTKP